MKELKRQNTEKDPIIDDVKEDIILLKDLFKKHSTKLDKLEAEELSSPKFRPAPKQEK